MIWYSWLCILEIDPKWLNRGIKYWRKIRNLQHINLKVWIDHCILVNWIRENMFIRLSSYLPGDHPPSAAVRLPPPSRCMSEQSWWGGSGYHRWFRWNPSPRAFWSLTRPPSPVLGNPLCESATEKTS